MKWKCFQSSSGPAATVQLHRQTLQPLDRDAFPGHTHSLLTPPTRSASRWAIQEVPLKQQAGTLKYTAVLRHIFPHKIYSLLFIHSAPPSPKHHWAQNPSEQWDVCTSWREDLTKLAEVWMHGCRLCWMKCMILQCLAICCRDMRQSVHLEWWQRRWRAKNK